MNESELKKISMVLIAVIIISVLVLVIDIGIKNTILQKAEYIDNLFKENRDRAAETATAGIRANHSDSADVLGGATAGMENRDVPSGGHDEAKIPFSPRATRNGRPVNRTPRGHKSIPPSDEPVGA